MTTTTHANWNMEVMNKDFIYDIMSVPTCTFSEYMLANWIENWATQRGIVCEKDEMGNLYLTKGKIAEGEYYPCLTSHLDTVQNEQRTFVESGKRLDIITEEVNGRHKLSCKGFGIGADCKSGVAICLAIMEQAEAMKCCFFVQEERGCLGSMAMDPARLSQVGYVLGFDSPEHDRAAWSCMGTALYDADFFRTYLKDVCAHYGLTNFRAEPYTDVKIIRERTGLTCTNFGNGGYYAHTPIEYCIAEDMDLAAQMGLALVEKIGRQRIFSQQKLSAEDVEYLRSLSKRTNRRLW